MGAKDLYLLQIVQHSANESEKKPSQWAFFIHFADKAGQLTNEGEIHEIQVTRHGSHNYVHRRATFLTPTFRGACTLGLFYKKNLYKIHEELEDGKLRVGMDSLAWVEDRLEALRRAGVVLLGPSLQEMARKAYKSWKLYSEEKKTDASLSQTREVDFNTDTSDIVKKYYCYPYTHYGTA